MSYSTGLLLSIHADDDLAMFWEDVSIDTLSHLELRRKALCDFSRQLTTGKVSRNDLDYFDQLLRFSKEQREEDQPITLHVPIDENGYWVVAKKPISTPPEERPLQKVFRQNYCLMCDVACRGFVRSEHGLQHHRDHEAGPLVHMRTRFTGSLQQWAVGCANALMNKFISKLLCYLRYFNNDDNPLVHVHVSKVKDLWNKNWKHYWKNYCDDMSTDVRVIVSGNQEPTEFGFLVHHEETVKCRALAIARELQVGQGRMTTELSRVPLRPVYKHHSGEAVWENEKEVAGNVVIVFYTDLVTTVVMGQLIAIAECVIYEGTDEHDKTIDHRISAIHLSYLRHSTYFRDTRGAIKCLLLFSRLDTKYSEMFFSADASNSAELIGKQISRSQNKRLVRVHVEAV